MLVLVAAVATGAAVAAALVRRSRERRRRQNALVDLLRECIEDTDCCHLFIYPRSPLGPSLTDRCIEAETILRLSRVPYVAHFVERPSDITLALSQLPPSSRPPLVARAHTDIGPRAQGRAASVSGSAPGRVDEELAHHEYGGRTVSGYDGDVPLLLYSREGVFIGCRAITQFVADHYKQDLDADLTEREREEGRALRECCRVNIAQCLVRALRDNPGIAGRFIGTRLRLPAARSPLAYLYYLLFRGRPGALSLPRRATATSAGAPAVDKLSPIMYREMLRTDIGALEEQLGDQPYLQGDRPTTADCAAFAVLLPVLLADEADMRALSAGTLLFLQSPALWAYMGRLVRLAYADLGVLTLQPVKPGQSVRYDYKFVTDMRGVEEEVIGYLPQEQRDSKITTLLLK